MADDRSDWIRERLASGDAPDRIVAELVDAGWTESGAEQAVWRVIGTGIDEGGGRDILPLVLSGAALVVSLAVAAFILTGAGGVATPVQPGDSTGNGGPAGNDTQTGDGDGPNTVTLEIQDGVLSAPSQQVTPLPARLRMFNGDDRAYTVESSGLGISTTIEAGGQAIYDIGQAGTYTLTVTETGESTTFQVE